MPAIPQEFRTAYREYDREITIRKTKWGCWLGIVLVPLFGLLDLYVYKPYAFDFLLLRLLCSALMFGLYFVLRTNFGRKYYHFQGLVLLFLPSATIAWMVYATEGMASPYYAGLILVLMVLAVLLDWPIWQSIVSVLLVLSLYVAACLFSPAETDSHKFADALFFLTSCGIAIIAGAYFHSGVRIREFVARSELDKSRKALELSLQQLKENEMQLVQSEKLASLGRMSAGIIHEINNPLNFATTGLFTLRNKAKYIEAGEREEYQEILKDVEDGILRVKNIVTDLRMFTHPETESRDQVELSEVLTASLRFLSNEWKSRVEIVQDLPEHQTVWANKNKLIHVVTNLLQNSLDALKGKTFTDEKPTIWIEGRLDSTRSILVVRDNGTGITKEHLDKIFDPFYTTKDVGQGMGLGLAICYRIVQDCDGRIQVRTEPGKFCEFTLEFPAKG